MKSNVGQKLTKSFRNSVVVVNQNQGNDAQDEVLMSRANQQQFSTRFMHPAAITGTGLSFNEPSLIPMTSQEGTPSGSNTHWSPGNPDYRTRESAALTNLTEVLVEFQKNYTKFTHKNRHFFVIDEGIFRAIQTAMQVGDIKRSSELFEQEISNTLLTLEKNQIESKSKWTSKLGRFVVRLYPIAKICLSVSSTAAEVVPRHFYSLMERACRF